MGSQESQVFLIDFARLRQQLNGGREHAKERGNYFALETIKYKGLARLLQVQDCCRKDFFPIFLVQQSDGNGNVHRCFTLATLGQVEGKYSIGKGM